MTIGIPKIQIFREGREPQNIVKKAQDLLNLVLFMFVAFSYYKDGGALVT